MPTDFGRPVRVREPRVGEDARAYAARERVARIEDGRRLQNDRAFIEDEHARFGAPSE